jgi:3-oxoacyl-[acyl-carrier-protein] synthase-1
MPAGAPGGVVCVTACGMIGPLGYDVRTNAAAVRAGMANGRELDFRIRSSVDGDAEAVVGHAVPDYTHGFEGPARLERVAQGALGDLARQTAGVRWGAVRHAFYLSLPDPRRIATGMGLVADDEARETRAGRVKELEADVPPAPPPAELAQRLLRRAAAAARWHGEPSVGFATTGGHTGVAEAVRAAALDLAENRVDAAVVGGVDSLLDEDTLVWLQNTGRLKCSGVPDGLQPGEAGAFFVLERSGDGAASRKPTGEVLADVTAGAVAEEAGALLAGGLSTGRGTAEVLLDLLRQQPQWREEGAAAWVVLDHNGETYRAMDWGHAAARLAGPARFVADAVTEFPAASLGDTGAASGAVAVCLAAVAFRRRYARARTAAVVSVGDGPGRAGFLLRAPAAA